ncbi:hypothetical protein JR316_0006454 [Psilocybe cubensis]|uniref:Uncharacterized protein n=2 Tax=Psilocybe cubensis TaxID=181762 RepID=A0ACB8H3X6_PSICU|nr:hypothetical protein JR316_0006454 [Psilocybe cubensis]KAH9481924.1 hypothetical protein JR316_0006454 [Psilocybe cubensis]
MAILIAQFFRMFWNLLCFPFNTAHNDDSMVGDGVERGVDYTGTLPEIILASIFIQARPSSGLNLRIQAVHSLTPNSRRRSSTDLRPWTILASNICYWKRIDIELDRQTVFDFLELPLTNASMLENLSITVVVRDAQELPTKILDYLQTVMESPTFTLQRLTWECIPVESMTTHSLWGSLREIHLNMGLTMDQGIEFLRSCLRAENIALACITTDCVAYKEHELQLEAVYRELMSGGLGTLPPPQRRMLPNLRRLSVGMGGVVGDCIPILQFFILPALTHLEIQCFDTRKQSWELLKDFLRRSAQSAEEQWNIQKLSIVDHNMAQWLVEKVLSAPGVPKISCYTRRAIDVQKVLEKLGWSMELIVLKDSWGGTCIEYSSAVIRQ